jgi:hypothetical protein
MAPKLILRFCPRNPGPAFIDGDRFHDEMAVLAVTFARHQCACWGSWELRLYLSTRQWHQSRGIWRRLRVVEKLSPADRNAVIKYAEPLARGAGQKNDDEAA